MINKFNIVVYLPFTYLRRQPGSLVYLDIPPHDAPFYSKSDQVAEGAACDQNVIAPVITPLMALQ